MRSFLSALKRTVLTAPYWTNAFQTFKYFTATRLNILSREPLTLFRYKELLFGIRPIDWYAMESIIIEQEYKPIKQLFETASSGIIIDAGANIGLFPIYILSLCPNAEIHSIEASPETYAILKQNQERNPKFRWHIHQYALWGQDGDVYFANEGLSIGWHITSTPTDTRVPALRLDNFINKILPKDCRIDLLKMDIEGAEQSVLQACPEILDRVDALLLEIHPASCDQAAVINIVKEKFKYMHDLSPAGDHFPILLATQKPLSTI